MRFKEDFKIKHYAGDVVYDVNGFVEKNRDVLFSDLKRLFYNSSTNAVVRGMFASDGAIAASSVQKRPPTAGATFKKSMGELVEHLMSKQPQYVRCIKPNALKSPTQFEEPLVAHQVQYLGLVENVRVRRAGFASRMAYQRFVDRYKLICPSTWPKWERNHATLAEATSAIIATLPGSDHETSYGNTKVFIRHPQTVTSLESARRDRMPFIVTIIAAHWRGYAARRLAKRMRAAKVILAALRRFNLILYVDELVRLFQNAKNDPDLGRSLQWPKAPPVTVGAVEIMKKFARRWRGAAALKRVPQEQWPELRAKGNAWSVLSPGNTTSRRVEWGLNRHWQFQNYDPTDEGIQKVMQTRDRPPNFCCPIWIFKEKKAVSLVTAVENRLIIFNSLGSFHGRFDSKNGIFCQTILFSTDRFQFGSYLSGTTNEIKSHSSYQYQCHPSVFSYPSGRSVDCPGYVGAKCGKFRLTDFYERNFLFPIKPAW